MIPYAYRGRVQKELQSLQAQRMIEPVNEPTEWCAPIAMTLKKFFEDMCICEDFSNLDKYEQSELYYAC